MDNYGHDDDADFGSENIVESFVAEVVDPEGESIDVPGPALEADRHQRVLVVAVGGTGRSCVQAPAAGWWFEAGDRLLPLVQR
ncbi:hypothetical protein OG413_27700 [Streptomyces sp. NBC_01433]|uniref:hypothetical protein n=1 Tax=Streptomyces sp. NBC_01433 TaxID=2903864 RepID=UPI002252DEBA|nr:hypothetical protein [Streptomyces sp. NBC_01433]MCX4679050.1 hypothetical protein [Streptomyces sp. NBC_01433]